jgi:hypothetical protein
MTDADDVQPDHQPVPRAWREEFDGIKPIRPIACHEPAPKEPSTTRRFEGSKTA